MLVIMSIGVTALLVSSVPVAGTGAQVQARLTGDKDADRFESVAAMLLRCHPPVRCPTSWSSLRHEQSIDVPWDRGLADEGLVRALGLH